jgi:hypothetical protein
MADSLKNVANVATARVIVRRSWERYGRLLWDWKVRDVLWLLTGNGICFD